MTYSGFPLAMSPVGSPKSRTSISFAQPTNYRGSSHTLVPGIHDLDCVDDLGIKTGRDLNPHAGWEENEIQGSEIALLVPDRLVLLGHTREDWIGDILLALLADSDHIEKVANI